MKISNIIKQVVLCLSLVIWLTSCNKDITDFGFDGVLSGKLKDQAGNIVAGDITSNSLAIKVLGENDNVTIDLRVRGDGTYQNTKLFPKKSKVWVTGPIKMVGDTLRIDFSQNKIIQHDFIVIPFLTIKPPIVVGNPTSTSVTLSYEVIPNENKTPNLIEAYCSTNPYPNGSTGSGPSYHTLKVTMKANAGSVTISGLTAKTKYYIRIGARANGTTALNYSEQITITTL